MKKIAVFVLAIFFAVQAAPALLSAFSAVETVFMVDEEKGESIKQEDKKDKKNDNGAYFIQLISLTQKIRTAFHVAENITAFPCLEKLTPPPNFC